MAALNPSVQERVEREVKAYDQGRYSPVRFDCKPDFSTAILRAVDPIDRFLSRTPLRYWMRQAALVRTKTKD